MSQCALNAKGQRLRHARARGMAKVAREAALSRESLYKALSGERVPNFDTVLRVVALSLKTARRSLACRGATIRVTAGGRDGDAEHRRQPQPSFMTTRPSRLNQRNPVRSGLASVPGVVNACR